MRILLDTHTFLWMIFGDERLNETVRTQIGSRQNQVLISVATLWEIAIKTSLGKLDLKIPFEKIIEEQLDMYTFQMLPISFKALVAVSTMPFHHRDPFDRLLVAQAIVEDVPIVTRDSVFSSYPVKVLW